MSGDALVIIGLVILVVGYICFFFYEEHREAKYKRERILSGLCYPTFAHCYHTENEVVDKEGCEVGTQMRRERWWCCKCPEKGEWRNYRPIKETI